MITNVRMGTLEDGVYPDTVYKYRTWKDPNHQKILSERTVFMAPPTGFEDKKDCKILKRYDLITDDQIYSKYYESSKKMNTAWNDKQHHEFAQDWFKKSPLHDKEHIKQLQEKHFLEFDKRFGVLSLTANPLKNEMWEKYSDNYAGICVGFDSSKMFPRLGGGCQVAYYDVLPDILESHTQLEEAHIQAYSKERKWEFEDEYRTQTFSYEPLTIKQRCVILPKECYKHIFFGMNISTEDKNAVIEVCNKEDLKVSYYQAIKLESGEVIQKQL